MKQYSAPTCRFTIEDAHVCTDGSVLKKVSGTSMAGILGCSPWATQFTVSCNLLGLGQEDIKNKPAVKTGNALEAVIIHYADQTYSDIGQFIPAENVYEKRVGDHDAWVSDFDDDVFAGHVDGIVVDNNGEDYVLEVKTSTNLESWKNGVPEYYFWQVALYNEFICKKDKAYVVLGIVDEDTHKNPNSWVPNERTVVMFQMNIDRAKVQETMALVREWYSKYPAMFKTTDLDCDSKTDVEMMTYLKLLSEDIDEIRDSVHKLGILMDEMKEYQMQIDNKSMEIEQLKSDLKTYMQYKDTSQMDDHEGNYRAALSTMTRTSFDESKMRQDGVDPDKYKVKTESNVFKLKKIGE